MILYPAIDIQGGKCVRLRRGQFGDVTIFADDPVSQAQIWQKEGAQALHVVDLDGARTGNLVNYSIVEAIAGVLDIPVEFGGGIRSEAELKMIASGPVGRIVIGTGAVTDETFLDEAVAILGNRLVVSVDANDGMVTTHGWQKKSKAEAVTFAGYLKGKGVEHLLYTDIDRDGMMSGMNLRAVEELAKAVDIDIVASGGISSLDDLIRLKELNIANISSVIVGRALYEGKFTVKQAREVLD